MKCVIGIFLSVSALSVDSYSLSNTFTDNVLRRVTAAYETLHGFVDHNNYVDKLNTVAHKVAFMDSEPLGDSLSCGQCVGKGTCHIMQSVKEGWEKICQETKCPVLKKKCQLSAQHPRFSLGYQIAMVRPVEKSYFYCFGHGDCPHPGSHDTAEPLKDLTGMVSAQDELIASDLGDLVEQVFSDGNYKGFNGNDIETFAEPTNCDCHCKETGKCECHKGCKCPCCHPTSEEIDFEGATNCDCHCKETGKCECHKGCQCPCCHPTSEEIELYAGFSSVPIDNEEVCDDEGNCHDCPKCQRMKRCTVRVGIKAFKWGIHKIKQFCDHTECPFLKKKCKLAAKHPQIAAGYLWFKMRPMEWSSGFCHGKIMSQQD